MYRNEKIVAIIPARGGSKRIPNKNIIDFEGLPLIAWTIKAAQETGIFDDIIVSTDSSEIAKVSIEYGAEVPILRDTKADDYSPVSEATARTLVQLEELGRKYDTVVQLFSVCPLRTAQDILDSLEFFYDSKAPFMLSCYKFHWMNPWAAMMLNSDGKGKWIFERRAKRTQDHPELYTPTGAIWIAKVKKLIEENNFYGKGHMFWEMDWKRAVDIDDYEDLELASALFNMGKVK
jgi:N-acylneuraminate cytidylyltransferase